MLIVGSWHCCCVTKAHVMLRHMNLVKGQMTTMRILLTVHVVLLPAFYPTWQVMGSG